VRRLIVAGMPAQGHVNPTLPIVAELVRRGVGVVYYDSEQFRAALECTGAEFRPYPPGILESRDIAEATRSGSSVRVVTRILQATERLLPLMLDDVRATPPDAAPDAIAFDSNAVWGRMAAVTLGLPTVSLMTTFLLGTAELRRSAQALSVSLQGAGGAGAAADAIGQLLAHLR
jgi:UDP:flavonoid glycosyltransferase YjiC (YdhE family)